MALTEIEYGSLASSEVINQNNLYLENKIAEVSQTITSNTATINSNIATVNGSITSLSQNISDSISTINQNIQIINNDIAASALYISTYYNNGSWYREYFSDRLKTTRVWLEQGGITSTGGTASNYSVTFVKAFAQTPLITTGALFDNSGNTGSMWYVRTVSTTGFTCNTVTNRGVVMWYACGK